MKKITMKAYAKINLCFDILGRNDDNGMHYVDTVMQTIDLYDYVELSVRSDTKCRVTVQDDAVQDTNAIRAAEAFVMAFGVNGVNIHIVKRIPIGAGLGGSSADAAAVLRGMAILYGIDFGLLPPLAETIGADVCFLLSGGTARCTGYGEVIEQLEPLPYQFTLVATPDVSVTAWEAYRAFDEIAKKPYNIRIMDLVDNIRNGVSNRLLSTNILYNVVCGIAPEIGKTAEYINADKEPKHTAMSGSGSSYYALYTDIEKAYAHQANAPLDINVGVYQFVPRY